MTMDERNIPTEQPAPDTQGAVAFQQIAPPLRPVSSLRQAIWWVLSAALILTATLILLSTIPRSPAGEEDDPSRFDPAAYVDGLIKENYLGEYDPEYLEMVGITESSAEVTYENGIHMDIEKFFYIYGIEYPTDELHEEVEEFFKDVYSRTRYRVLSAEEQEDGSYAVQVEVDPLNLVQLAEAGREEAEAPFHEKYTSDMLNTMSDEKYEAVDQEWARLILDLYEAALEKAEYLDPVPLTLRLEQDESGYYTVNTEDFDALDRAILDYEGNSSSADTAEPVESADTG